MDNFIKTVLGEEDYKRYLRGEFIMTKDGDKHIWTLKEEEQPE